MDHHGPLVCTQLPHESSNASSMYIVQDDAHVPLKPLHNLTWLVNIWMAGLSSGGKYRGVPSGNVQHYVGHSRNPSSHSQLLQVIPELLQRLEEREELKQLIDHLTSNLICSDMFFHSRGCLFALEVCCVRWVLPLRTKSWREPFRFYCNCIWNLTCEHMSPLKSAW